MRDPWNLGQDKAGTEAALARDGGGSVQLQGSVVPALSPLPGLRFSVWGAGGNVEGWSQRRGFMEMRT